MPSDTPGTVITFYSYKGGTGRTMALANVACLLARRQSIDGRGVLMMDWDLEAPGLHQFFRRRFKRALAHEANYDEALDHHPGIIDLFLEIDEALERAGADDEPQSEEEAEQLLDGIKLDRFVMETDIPSLSLMKSGQYVPEYADRINRFRWERLYNRSPWLSRMLAERLAERFAYVLIDSRTGLTDVSGLCTMLMPQKLVVVFTPNRQSLDGAIDLAHRAVSYRRRSDDLRPLVIYPLASRIELNEQDLRVQWRKGNPAELVVGYEARFEALLRDVYDLPSCKLDAYFDEVQIPQLSRYAYGEEIAALVDPHGDRLSLTRGYEAFLDCLVDRGGPWELDPNWANSLANDRTDPAAIDQFAEGIYARFSHDEQATVQRALPRLVRLTPDSAVGKPTRQRALLADMGPDFDRIVETLATEHLVNQIQIESGTQVELADDSVLDWRRLGDWLTTDRDFLLWRQRLRIALWEWQRGGDEDLLRGIALSEAEGWLAARPADLSESETAFIQRSARVDREARAASKAFRDRTVVSVLILAVIVLGLLWNQSWLAIQQLNAEATPTPAATSAPPTQIADVSQTVSVEPILATPAPATPSAVATGGQPPRTTVIAVLPTRTAATGAGTSTAAITPTLVRVALPSPLVPTITLKGHTNEVYGAAYNADGTMIVTASADTTAIIWDARTGRQMTVLRGHSDFVTSAAFAPTSNMIATGSGDGTVRLWDLTGQSLATYSGAQGMIMSVAFDPSGRLLATGGADSITRLWEVGSKADPRELTGHTDTVSGVAFSPDGQLLVTSSWDGTARLWSIPSGQPIGAPLQTNPDEPIMLWSAVVSPDGKRIITGSDDGTAQIWDAATQQPIGPPLAGHTGAVTNVAFSPDGRYLATASWDTTARIWDVSTSDTPSTILELRDAHTGVVWSAVFSPDQRTVLTASADTTAIVWGAPSPRLPTPSTTPRPPAVPPQAVPTNTKAPAQAPVTAPAVPTVGVRATALPAPPVRSTAVPGITMPNVQASMTAITRGVLATLTAGPQEGR